MKTSRKITGILIIMMIVGVIPALAFNGENNFRGFSLPFCGGFWLNNIENANDTTFSTVQADTVSSLQNMTERLQNHENRSIAHNNTFMATQIANKITVLQGLTSNFSQATDAAGLQNVALTFTQGQISDSVNNQITRLQNREANVTNANLTAKINTRIANLQSFETNVSSATSLSALKQVVSPSRQGVACNSGQMRYRGMSRGGFRGHGRFGRW
jgi:hypothetical protein